MPFANVFSIGDVLIGIGGAMFIARSMHRHPVGKVGSVPAAERGGIQRGPKWLRPSSDA